jgi:hypothetical protein
VLSIGPSGSAPQVYVRLQFEEVERPPLGSPVVAVMQTAEPRGRNDAADALGRNSVLRGFFPESQMRAVLMVVADVFREQPLQMPFIHRDDVIQQVTAAALHPPFRHTVLPWTLKRSSDRSHVQGSNRRRNLESIFAVSVKDQEPGSRSEREGFPQLLNNPKACRVVIRQNSVCLPNQQDTGLPSTGKVR